MARKSASLSVIAGLLLASALAFESLAANEPASLPNFAPNNITGWVPDRQAGDDFLPPPSGPGPVVSVKERPYQPNAGTAGQSTFRVADLTNPILKPWAIEQMRKANEEVLAGKVPFRARERCYPAGVPAFVVYTLAEPTYFIQTARQVTMINQGGPEMRRVYLDVPHSAQVKPSWYGESVGHYEGGDTLVVDTVGVSAKSFVDNYRTPHTEQL